MNKLSTVGLPASGTDRVAPALHYRSPGAARRTRRVLLTACFLLMVVLTPGCKKDDAGGFLADCDVTPPLAGAISPTCGATQVAINQAVTVTFSESIEPSSLTSESFWLMGPGEVPVPGTVVYSGSTNIASFTPTNNLAPFTTYTYSLQGGESGIEDLFTNALANNFTCSFTTGGVPDNTPPTVTATVPLNNATGVSMNSIVTATFSESMDPLTISPSTFTVRGPGSVVVPGTITYAGSSFTAVFTPTNNLAPSATYTATVTTGSKDLSGNALAADYVWSFATGAAQDLTAPRVIATDPLDNAVDVALDKTLTATFSEVMDPTTITSGSFTLMQGGTPILGSVSYTGTVATFNPTVDLIPNTVYTARITTDARDLAGNALAENHVWVFTTVVILDSTAPRVLSTDPANNATNVSLNKLVIATFSESMNPLTINGSTIMVQNGSASISGTVTYAGPTFGAIFNPTSDFEPNTTYTGRITTGAQDLAGNGIAADYVWTFTTSAAQDLTAPFVTSTDPAANETGVAINKSVTATFSEAMNQASISSSTFTLRRGTETIAGVVSFTGTTATFNPTSDLAANTTYAGRITTGAEDLAGNGLAADYVWSFTTAAVLDVTAPRVLSTDPANNATNVSLNKLVIATFSESMDPLTINGNTFTVQNGSASVSGTVTYAGPTFGAIFNPTSDFAPSTTYTGRITTGAEDLAGNGIAADYVWVFTTGAAQDLTAPFVTSTDPAANETGVEINKSVTATFSEAMNLASISSVTFTLRQGLTPILGAVSYIGTTATFNPTVDFTPNTTYTGRITTGAEDLSGNGLAADYVWSFTTAAALDLTAPTVISTDPANLETGVLLNKSVTATFSEAMNQTTISSTTFTLRRGTTTVPGSVSYVGTTATFNPTTDFLPNTVYTGRISTGAEDLAGNGLAADYVWTFTTAALADLIPPIVVSTDPADLEIGVELSKSVMATFNEAMNPSTLTSSTFTLRRGTASVLGSVSYSGMTATFNPTSDFAPNTTYTGRITTGAEDLAGNGLVFDFVWTFTTAAALDVVAPTVILTDPDNNENGVALNKSVTAQFSEAMDPLTISSSTFTLSEGLNPILGSVSYLGTTATFNPNADFLAGTTYTARITTGAEDLAGNGLVQDYVWTFTTGTPVVGILAVDLTCAAGFATLAGSTITSTGPSVVNGDVGLSPGSALVGFPPGIINGVVHVNDPIAANAKGCLTTAFNDAAGRPPGTSVSGNIGGLTLTPGVYTSNSTLAISGGNLTLDAQGDANGVFIFQIASAFTMTSGRQVILAGGAQAKNVFWQVGTSATIGTTAIMMGVILADQSITLETGAVLNGSALTRIAAVSLDSSTVNSQ